MTYETPEMMDVDLELHAPGLDLEPERWNMHIVFMQSVHDRIRFLSALAWSNFNSAGKGTLYIGKEAWMEVIRGHDSTIDHFPCDYIGLDQVHQIDHVDRLGKGYQVMLEEYDPEKQLVLTVQHHKADITSAYLIRPSLPPVKASETWRHSARRAGRELE
jgi:hypothetical protein